jgi:quercetin dioxygenase-like cupin family protein
MVLNGADTVSGLWPRGGSFWMAGDRATIRLTGEETEGRLAVVEIFVVAGGGPPPHVHLREDETLVVLEGEVAFYLGEDRVLARAGDLVHVPRGSPH